MNGILHVPFSCLPLVLGLPMVSQKLIQLLLEVSLGTAF